MKMKMRKIFRFLLVREDCVVGGVDGDKTNKGIITRKILNTMKGKAKKLFIISVIS